MKPRLIVSRGSVWDPGPIEFSRDTQVTPIGNFRSCSNTVSTFSLKPLAISDVLLVPRKFSDHRGYFLETFSRKYFKQLGTVNSGCWGPPT